MGNVTTARTIPIVQMTVLRLHLMNVGLNTSLMEMEDVYMTAVGSRGPLGMIISNAASVHRSMLIMEMATAFIITYIMDVVSLWGLSYKELAVYALMGHGIIWDTVQ
jgi:hypothetical protein